MQQDDLIDRAMRKEQGAIEELIQQQRQGKHLRLYPEGRKGAEDEGMAPLIVGDAPSGLIRFSFGKEPAVKIQPYLVGRIMLSIMQKTVNMVHRYKDHDDVIEAIESQRTPDLKITSRMSPDYNAITCLFEPIEYRDFDLGVYHARRLVDSWITLILANQPLDVDDLIDPKWGLTEDQMFEVLEFVPPEEEDLM